MTKEIRNRVVFLQELLTDSDFYFALIRFLTLQR